MKWTDKKRKFIGINIVSGSILSLCCYVQANKSITIIVRMLLKDLKHDMKSIYFQ